MPTPHHRTPLIDTLKGLACAAVIWHHLSFYGPMSDVAQPLFPALIAWFSNHGRMAVQVFLVLGGYLAAASLAPHGVARFDSATQKIGQRFVRLVIPYAVALLLAVLASAVVRPWLNHSSVPDAPSLAQLLAHALLLQDVVGEEALSAGVWYVAIDFQLFALAVLLLAGVRHVAGQTAQAVVLGRVLVLTGCAASLLLWNRWQQGDMWAPYFWGAYGLGMAAHWAVRAPRAAPWLLGMAVLGVAALTLEFRGRILVALLTAMGLVWALRQPWPHVLDTLTRPWQRLGQMSYSVFLLHFSVCLLVNTVVSQLWPQSPALNALGMLAAFGLSLLAARPLYLRVERHVPHWTLALRWQAGLVGAGLLVGLGNYRG